MTRPWETPEDLEPARYLDAPKGDARRRVVLSAALDVPSVDAKARTIAMLGLDGVAPLSPPSPRRVGRWAIIGIAGLALLGGAALHFSTGSPRVASETPVNDRAPGSGVVVTAAPVAAIPTVSPPVVETASVPVAAPPAMPEKRREADDNLGPQLVLIDGARSSLAQGNPRDALSRLKEYDTRYPSGALGLEATALRVEALLRAGERARGQALGERFVAQHPKGPYAARIRSLLAQAP